MDKTNYQKVVEFHKTFGHPAPKNVDPSIWDNPKLIKLRLDLIKEEFNELQKAVSDKNQKEVADALSDILYVTYGMGICFGLDLDKAFGLVHDSNMSKICSSELEAIETVDWYKNEFQEGRLEYDSPKYRLAEDGKRWVVYNESSGKILKSIKYFPVDLSSIVENK